MRLITKAEFLDMKEKKELSEVIVLVDQVLADRTYINSSGNIDFEVVRVVYP